MAKIGPHHDFAEFLSRHLPGKVQKISVNAGHICPNRDGTKSTRGCTYCTNAGFSPAYTLAGHTVEQQLEQGKRFFARKYPHMTYLAYFQSYTPTNAPLAQIRHMLTQALSVPGIRGIIIGTRPDCMPQDLLTHLSDLAHHTFVMVEYGAETSHDTTLAAVNRCHTWADTVQAVTRTHAAGIHCGIHLINGLPGEEIPHILTTIDRVNTLPIETVKFHQMQILRGTPLATQYLAGETHCIQFTPQTYADLCVTITHRLRPDIAIERFLSQAPPQMLISPRWGLKNYQFMNLLTHRL